MAVEQEVKPRRPRRSKADIEEAIQKAATAQIKKKGFSLALVTDIVKRAKIEPIVFYNRYKNLDEFYDSFVKKYDYWLSDLIHSTSADMYTEAGMAQMLISLFDNLLQDKVITELLRWEITEGNHITERTARLRELHAVELIRNYEGMFGVDGHAVDGVNGHTADGSNGKPVNGSNGHAVDGVDGQSVNGVNGKAVNGVNGVNGKKSLGEDSDIVAAASLVVAGLYYIVLHKDRSSFGGIDINTPQGRERIHKACRSIAKLFFRHRDCERQIKEIAANMRAEGIPEDVIARCLKVQ